MIAPGNHEYFGFAARSTTLGMTKLVVIWCAKQQFIALNNAIWYCFPPEILL
jgi:hypothetical protein